MLWMCKTEGCSFALRMTPVRVWFGDRAEMFSEFCRYSTQDVGVLASDWFCCALYSSLRTSICNSNRWETGGQKECSKNVWKVEQRHEVIDTWNSNDQPVLKERETKIIDWLYFSFLIIQKWNAFSSTWCDLELFIVTGLNSYIVLTLLLI